MSERLRRVVDRLDRVARLHREPRLAERWLAPGGTLVSEYD
jgi:hypothetical protein